LSAAVRMAELERENTQLQAQLATVQQQLEWFKRQLFGAKSEKRLDVDPSVQADLLSALGVAAPPPPPEVPTETIRYQRRPKARDAAVNDSGLRFAEDVPREIIAVTTSPLRKTDPLVLKKPDPGDAHLCANIFSFVFEKLVAESLWTLWARGLRVWASCGQQGC